MLILVFVLVNKEALKGLLNGITLAFLVHLCAPLIITTYGVVIFEKVGVSKIDPYYATILIGVLQLVGALCSTKFADTLGRKSLMILSVLGSALGLFIFALYSYLKQNEYNLTEFEWIPVTSLSLVIFFSSAGIAPLFLLCVVENLPSKVHPHLFFNCKKKI